MHYQGIDLTKLDTAALDAVVKKPWAADGANFSDRIWMDKKKLMSALQEELIQGIIRGEHPNKIASRMAKRMDVSKSNARRLVLTEAAYFASAGELASMEALGVENYEFIATLDHRTSDICRAMDGKIISIKNFKPGITAPPLHPYCRSCTSPTSDMKLKGSTRLARDTDGKNVRIPGNMKYADWMAAFVDQTVSADEWVDSHMKKDTIIVRGRLKNRYDPNMEPQEYDDWAINRIQKDLKNSGDEAKEIQEAIKGYTDFDFISIRKRKNAEFARKADVIEDYIKKAPKYRGTLYRGVLSSTDRLQKLLQNQDELFGMGGISSWTSKRNLAGYNFARVNAKRVKSDLVSIIFRIDKANDPIGVSITHISLFGAEEGEVLLPESAKFRIIKIRKYRETKNRREYYLIDLEGTNNDEKT